MATLYCTECDNNEQNYVLVFLLHCDMFITYHTRCINISLITFFSINVDTLKTLGTRNNLLKVW